MGVYDIESGKEVALIESNGDESKHLRQAVVDEKNNKIYISTVGGMSRDDKPGPKSAIWVIDGASDKLESVILDPVAMAAVLALDTDKQLLYVSDLGSNEVAEIDLNSQKCCAPLPRWQPLSAGRQRNQIPLIWKSTLKTAFCMPLIKSLAAWL